MAHFNNTCEDSNGKNNGQERIERKFTVYTNIALWLFVSHLLSSFKKSALFLLILIQVESYFPFMILEVCALKANLNFCINLISILSCPDAILLFILSQ